MKIKLLTAIQYQGAVVEKGKILDVKDGFGQEMVDCGRAEEVKGGQQAKAPAGAPGAPGGAAGAAGGNG